jgi:NRPS condensation-like uncharacterized protein
MKIKLDHLGQFYAAVHSPKNPGTYSVGVHLHEPLQPKILQQAVNDYVKRMPHMHVRQRAGFLHYYNETLATPLVIEKDCPARKPCRYFKKSGALLRIVYGARHFTLEVLHTVCDGRSLAMAASSILIRYYRLLAVNADTTGFVDCDAAPNPEESQDAYATHADMRKFKSPKPSNVHIPKHKRGKLQVITQSFPLSELKPKARARGTSITEYIMAHIFMQFALQRSCKKPITCSIPIDCRGFIPTKCLRNFVTQKIIKMPETTCFTAMHKGIKQQFAGITAGYVQGNISEMERMIRPARFVPLFIKKWIIRSVGNSATSGCSTAFSNLGAIKLPPQIQSKIAMYTFTLGEEPHMPYQFACVATGDTLTLTATTNAQSTKLIRNIFDALAHQ